MENPLENNKAGLYRFLYESDFANTEYTPLERHHHPYTMIGLSLPDKQIANPAYAKDIEEMGMPQWLATDLCFFYNSFTEASNFIFRMENNITESNTNRFNSFILKIAKSIYCRRRDWDAIYSRIKVHFLEAVQLAVENQDIFVDDIDTSIKYMKKAIMVAKRDSGYNGHLVDILNYFLIGVDNPDPEQVIELNPATIGSNQYNDITRDIHEIILWSVFWEFKEKYKGRVPADLFQPIPHSFALNPHLQQLYIEEIRDPMDFH